MTDAYNTVVQIVAGSVIFGVYEVFGFEAGVIVALALIVMALADITSEVQDQTSPPTADDLE
jgi:hypothetical protein